MQADAEVAEPDEAPSRWRYDLSSVLYTPETLFTEPVDDRTLVFAPDWKGLPVLLNAGAVAVLDAFRGGAVVSDVLGASDNFVAALMRVGELFDHGFLREQPVALPYPMPRPQRGASAKSVSVWLHITNFCNLGCSYCFVGEKSHEGMAPETMDRVVEDLHHTALTRGCEEIAIKFAGGEPTLALPAMEMFHAKLQARMAGSGVKTRYGILTNGTVLNRPLLDFIVRNGIGVSISVDGFGESHDIHRVFAGSARGSWDIMQRTVETLGAHGVFPYMMGTISEESCDTLPELVQWLYAHNLRARLSVVRQPKGSWQQGQREAYARLTSTLAAAFDRAFELLEDPAIAIDLRSGMDLCELQFDEPAQGQPCGIASNHLVIKPDGTLASCPMEVMKPGVASDGDLLSSCSKTFAFDPSDRYYEDPEAGCLHCRWFGVCAGGCPVTNLRIKGHAYTRSPLCAFYKAVIPRYLRFFGRKLLQAEAAALGAAKPVDERVDA